MAGSYYDILGVSSSASAEEIKAAYRYRARATHPDRSPSSALDMAALNDAYRVLRDPVARAEYDRRLRGEPSPSPAAPPGADSAWTPGPPPGIRLRAPRTRTAHPAAPWIVFGALLVGAVALVLAALVGGGSSDVGPAVDGIVGPGSCVITAPGRAEVAEVACDQPHDGVAVAVVDFDQTCPSGTEFYVNPANTQRVCVRLG